MATGSGSGGGSAAGVVTLKWYDESLRGKLYEGAILSTFSVPLVENLCSDQHQYRVNELREFILLARHAAERFQTIHYADEDEMHTFFHPLLDSVAEELRRLAEMVSGAQGYNMSPYGSQYTPHFIKLYDISKARFAVGLCGFTAKEIELLSDYKKIGEYYAHGLLESIREKIVYTQEVFVAKHGQKHTFEERDALTRQMAEILQKSALFFLFVLYEKLMGLYRAMPQNVAIDTKRAEVDGMISELEAAGDPATMQLVGMLRGLLESMMSPKERLGAELKQIKGMYFDNGGVTIGSVRLESESG